VFSAGALASALVVARYNLVRVRHVIIGASTFGAAMFALAFAPDIAVTVPIVFLIGITSILYMTSTTSIVQVEADPTVHGRILALQTVLMVGTAPIGGPIVGAIADAFGARAPLVIGGLASIAAAVWGHHAVKSARASTTTLHASP
jgi:MFS family permease